MRTPKLGSRVWSRWFERIVDMQPNKYRISANGNHAFKSEIQTETASDDYTVRVSLNWRIVDLGNLALRRNRQEKEMGDPRPVSAPRVILHLDVSGVVTPLTNLDIRHTNSCPVS